MKRTFASLHGLKVMVGKRVIGKVIDLELDVVSWLATGLVVRLENMVTAELGQKLRLGTATIVISLDHVKSVADHIELEDSVQQLAQRLAGQAATAP
jgi:sporulation protein YlmC with PRC-barrel domain